MKRLFFPVLVLFLLLSSCSAPDLHPEWDESWVRIGDHIGVEPMEGFSPDEANDTLSLSGIYYYTWTCGAGQAYVNAKGENAEVYDAVIYVLLQECGSAEEAERNVSDWLSLEAQTYSAGDARIISIGGQEYHILVLNAGSEANPYNCGAAAFAARDGLAVSVELLCTDRFEGDAQETVTRFIAGFHYGD